MAISRRTVAKLLINPLLESAIRRKKFAANNAIVVLGSPRSGTTWLATLLQDSIPKSATIWEPLHPKAGVGLPEFGWRPMSEDLGPDGALRLKSILELKYMKDWLFTASSRREVARSNTLIVKFVRANGIIREIAEAADLKLPPIVIFRHPLAVARSHHKAFAKDNPDREAAMKVTLQNWYLDNADLLNRTSDGSFVSLFYEDLLLDPANQLAEVLAALGSWGGPSSKSDLAHLYRNPSGTDFQNDLRPVEEQLWKGVVGASAELQETMKSLSHRYESFNYVPDDPRPSGGI